MYNRCTVLVLNFCTDNVCVSKHIKYPAVQFTSIPKVQNKHLMSKLLSKKINIV